MPKVMKKKIRLSVEEQIDSFSHMKFTAVILIDDRIVNIESIYFDKLDSASQNSIDLLKDKFNSMYQYLLRYRERYKFESMRVSLDFSTSHYVDNLLV